MAVASTLDLTTHDGVHPRLGALDVVPFVALGDTAPMAATVAARAFATWWGAHTACRASSTTTPTRTTGAFRRCGVRRSSTARLSRSCAPHLRLGGTAVGARRPLVALNCVLDGGAVEDAQAIAHAARERDGGCRESARSGSGSRAATVRRCR